MKKYIISLLAAVFAFASCESINLDEVVYSSLTDDIAFDTAENAMAAINGLYDPLHAIYEVRFNVFNDVITDGGYSESHAANWEAFNMNAIYEHEFNEDIWNKYYKIVSRANVILDIVPTLDPAMFVDAGMDVNVMLGQAYFMRAFAYYNLTDLYYQVPLVTDSKIGADAVLPFSPIADIEAQIEADLVEAEKLLPQKYEGGHSEAQRATYGAACGFLARLYMRAAGRTRLAGGSDASLWQKALAEVNKVLALDGSVYSLQPHVWDIYNPWDEANLYNNEQIFSVYAHGTNSSVSWNRGLYYTTWDYDMGWCMIGMPLGLMWKMDPADERYNVLLITEHEDIYSSWEWSNLTYYKCSPTIEESGSMVKKYQHNYPTDHASDWTFFYERDYCQTIKFKFTHTGEYIYETPNNSFLLRLADMYLCKAEILNELNGPSEEGISCINKIRERAFQNSDHNYKVSDFADKAALRSAICDERLFELYGEGTRRPDLIRMGLWKDRMREYVTTIAKKWEYYEVNNGKPKGYFDDRWVKYPKPEEFSDYDLYQYYPIPKKEIVINPDLADARDYVK